MAKMCILNYVKTIAAIELLITFLLYLMPIALNVCTENGYPGCGVKNLYFTFGSRAAKNFLIPLWKEFTSLSNNNQWLLIIFVLTLNFVRMFCQSISLLRASMVGDVKKLQIWICLEIISSCICYLVLFNPWVFSWGNTFLYSITIVITSIYKLFTIFPIIAYRNYLVNNIDRTHRELTNEDVGEMESSEKTDETEA